MASKRVSAVTSTVWPRLPYLEPPPGTILIVAQNIAANDEWVPTRTSPARGYLLELVRKGYCLSYTHWLVVLSVVIVLLFGRKPPEVMRRPANGPRGVGIHFRASSDSDCWPSLRSWWFSHR